MINHAIKNIPLDGELPEKTERILFGMGCFWGVEKCFWDLDGVYRTAVGYAGGGTANPTYEEICTGKTGHAEVVEIVYFPEIISIEQLLAKFWENHDPTQGMRQGNDKGSSYRSMLVCFIENQLQMAIKTLLSYQTHLTNKGHGDITTEIRTHQKFYLAEEYHQQYLHKNPNGYCALKGTGVTF